MRRPLGTSLALTVLSTLLLSGCESDADPRDPTDATGTSESSPSDEQSDGDAAGPVDYEVVALLDETAAGGQTSPMLTSVEDPDALDAFTAQFRGGAFGAEIRAAADTSYVGQLWAAVVSLGCDVPSEVFVEEGEAGYLITPAEVINPLPECLAAVTTVALVAIVQP